RTETDGRLLGHFFSEMDRCSGVMAADVAAEFQWGHFFSEMDRWSVLEPLLLSTKCRFASIDDFSFIPKRKY
ncbi:MAG TPA: hypothetical protein PKK11_06675, partial [Methanothrix sp.]|nr:hypothetical protein [Methanothrix sp.]